MDQRKKAIIGLCLTLATVYLYVWWMVSEIFKALGIH